MRRLRAARHLALNRKRLRDAAAGVFAIAEAEQQRREAAKLSEVRRQALARRESELRSAEHVLDEVLEERAALALRDEQRALDDLSAARARRDG